MTGSIGFVIGALKGHAFRAQRDKGQIAGYGVKQMRSISHRGRDELNKIKDRINASWTERKNKKNRKLQKEANWVISEIRLEMINQRNGNVTSDQKTWKISGDLGHDVQVRLHEKQYYDN